MSIRYQAGHDVNGAIDIAATIAYFIAATPNITGLAVHEWVSLGVLVVFVVHVAQHYDWIADTLRKLTRHPPLSQTGNLALDVATVIAFIVAMVSGIMVSRYVLPALGFVAPGYFFWLPTHLMSAKILLALLVVHVAVHARPLWSYLKGRRHSKDIPTEKTEEVS
jgi:hypothetical protein